MTKMNTQHTRFTTAYLTERESQRPKKKAHAPIAGVIGTSMSTVAVQYA